MNVRRRWRRGKPQQDQHLTGPDGSRCLRETTTRRDEECSNGRLRSECGAQARRKLRRTPEHGGTGERRRRASAAEARRSRRMAGTQVFIAARKRSHGGGSNGTKDGASALAARKRRHGWRIVRECIPQGSGLVLRDGPKRAANGRRGDAGLRDCATTGPGDRRETRMPLPARVEHAAETRPCGPSGSMAEVR